MTSGDKNKDGHVFDEGVERWEGEKKEAIAETGEEQETDGTKDEIEQVASNAIPEVAEHSSEAVEDGKEEEGEPVQTDSREIDQEPEAPKSPAPVDAVEHIFSQHNARTRERSTPIPSLCSVDTSSATNDGELNEKLGSAICLDS